MQVLPVRSVVLPSRRGRVVLAAAAALLVLSAAVFLALTLTHQLKYMFSWYDLQIYNHGGLVARNHPGMLYVWRSIKFTYTPFAALLFAATSLLPWTLLKYLMVAASVIALALTIWLTFGGLGWRGRARAVGTLVLCAVGLWSEPVARGMHLGQIELLLMLLIVWDMTQDDRRRWKGVGVGLAAGIKLVPLIFIPYLVLVGKLRQAAVATAVFAGTVAVGFVFLPASSDKWWLTGYFLNSSNVGGVGSLLNQSVLGILVRGDHGNVTAVTPVWILLAVVIAVLGLAAAAVLHRAGQPVAGWLACALTGLLISPISWDHHWLWVVPGLALLADAAIRRRGGLRWTWWTLAGLIVLIYQAWPRYWTGPASLLPAGLLGYVPYAKQAGLGWVSINLFVLAGLVLFVVVLAAAAGTWRAGRGRPGPPGGPVNLPAPTTAGHSG